MYYLLIYLLIPFFAVLLDFLVSYLLLNRLTMFGTSMASEDHLERTRVKADQGSVADRYKEFVFAIQNVDRDPWDSPTQTIEVEFTIPGQGEFVSHEQDGMICVSHGPDDRPSAQWKSEARRGIVVQIPRLRPWKTWVFRCYVTKNVYEMRMEMRVPRRLFMRSILQRINEHTFQWTGIDFHSRSLIVRDRPVYSELKAGWRGTLHILFPALSFFTIFYLVFANGFLVNYMSRMETIRAAGGNPKIVDLRFLWVDAILFICGVCCLYLLSRSKPVPLTPGYKEKSWLTLEA